MLHFYETGKEGREIIYKEPFRVKLPSMQKKLYLRKPEIIARYIVKKNTGNFLSVSFFPFLITK